MDGWDFRKEWGVHLLVGFDSLLLEHVLAGDSELITLTTHLLILAAGTSRCNAVFLGDLGC